MIVPLNRTIKLKKQQQSPIITEKHTHGKTAERESGSDQRERERTTWSWWFGLRGWAPPRGLRWRHVGGLSGLHCLPGLLLSETERERETLEHSQNWNGVWTLKARCSMKLLRERESKMWFWGFGFRCERVLSCELGKTSSSLCLLPTYLSICLSLCFVLAVRTASES